MTALKKLTASRLDLSWEKLISMAYQKEKRLVVVTWTGLNSAETKDSLKQMAAEKERDSAD